MLHGSDTCLQMPQDDCNQKCREQSESCILYFVRYCALMYWKNIDDFDDGSDTADDDDEIC